MGMEVTYYELRDPNARIAFEYYSRSIRTCQGRTTWYALKLSDDAVLQLTATFAV